MNTYRSLSVIKAVQYIGLPIEDVTCGGTDKDFREKGCDNSRRHLPHVHTAAVGGLTALRLFDWIYPSPGGPFAVVSDEKFRGYWEVPAPVSEPSAQQPAGEPGEAPPVPESSQGETPAYYTVNVQNATFSASSLPLANPETVVSDLKAIDDILSEASADAEDTSK